MLSAYVVLQGFVAGLRCRGDRGATAVEYTLIAGLIALVIAGAVAALGTKVNSLFNSVVTAF
jgi:pilus assembly protein Flp/PilA